MFELVNCFICKEFSGIFVRFRLLAVDHDILSFVDTSLHKWPLVLITNPVDAEFKVPEREPLGRILHSTHIR